MVTYQFQCSAHLNILQTSVAQLLYQDQTAMSTLVEADIRRCWGLYNTKLFKVFPFLQRQLCEKDFRSASKLEISITCKLSEYRNTFQLLPNISFCLGYFCWEAEYSWFKLALLSFLSRSCCL